MISYPRILSAARPLVCAMPNIGAASWQRPPGVLPHRRGPRGARTLRIGTENHMTTHTTLAAFISAADLMGVTSGWEIAVRP